MKKKFNKHQHTEKTQNFKRKHRRRRMHMKTISNKIHNPIKQCDIIQQTEDRTSIMTTQSTLTKKKYYPLEIQCNIDPTVFLSDYSILSNSSFKEILINRINI